MKLSVANMNRKIVVLFALTMFVSALSAADGRERRAPEFRPHAAYALLEKLARIPPQLTVLEVSSHNKKGVNGDADWPLYKDERGDDVIFDASGPGCIKSMWGTAFDPNAVLQFYFDGDKEPRLRVNVLEFYQDLASTNVDAFEAFWSALPAISCRCPWILAFSRSWRVF